MSSKRKTQRYEAIPVRMACPAVPVPARDTLSKESTAVGNRSGPRSLSATGLRTLSDNVEEASDRTEALLRRCREQIDAKPWALLDLLDNYPELNAEVWVGETLLRLIWEGKLKRRRGRPFSRYKIHPLVVVGLVNALIETGEAAYPEKAFYCLEYYGFLSFNEAKRLYHQARRENRFKSILMRLPGVVRHISREELDSELADVEVLMPDQTINRTAEDPDLGPVTITFTATD